MQRKLVLAAALVIASPLSAQFTNGGFENGTASGWTTGGGFRGSILNNALNPSSFLPGGANSQVSNRSAVVAPGVMANTDGRLNQVYSGNFSYRVEDLADGGFASVITQRVNNYRDANIFFAWAAVLEGAHGVNDGAVFKLLLRDETRNLDLLTRTFTAATGGGGVDSRFALSSTGYYYTTTWQIEQLDVSAFIGNDFSLMLLAADCSPTAHQGTVFLDGFGATTPPPVIPPDSGVVPEPSTYALMATGFLGLIGIRHRRRTAAAAAAGVA